MEEALFDDIAFLVVQGAREGRKQTLLMVVGTMTIFAYNCIRTPHPRRSDGGTRGHYYQSCGRFTCATKRGKKTRLEEEASTSLELQPRGAHLFPFPQNGHV